MSKEHTDISDDRANAGNVSNAGNVGNVSIDRKLIEEGSAQLTSEIQVLEAWLRELDASDDGDTEVVAARKSYNDMLQSRKEMLCALAKQA
jgi:hypothetical protein